MWIIFNPTDNNLKYEINFKKWELKAGETKKFPNEIGREMFNIHGFLDVLQRDDVKPMKTYKPPQDLSNIEEADAEPLRRERKITHPSSNPKVIENMGFSGGSIDEVKDQAEAASGLPPHVREELDHGKLMKIDKDGVGWYGAGAELDNPLARD